MIIKGGSEINTCEKSGGNKAPKMKNKSQQFTLFFAVYGLKTSTILFINTTQHGYSTLAMPQKDVTARSTPFYIIYYDTERGRRRVHKAPVILSVGLSVCLLVVAMSQEARIGTPTQTTGVHNITIWASRPKPT